MFSQSASNIELKVALDTFLDFADYLSFELSAWKRGYTISFDLQSQ